MVPLRRVDGDRGPGAEGARASSCSTTPGTRSPDGRSGQLVPFSRVLLKLSGEALMGTREYGIDAATVDTLALELVAVRASGPELSVVIGGGNIYRGHVGGRRGHGPRDRRLHGDARHGAERTRRAGGARAARSRHAGHVGDRDAGGRGAVHQAPRRTASREGPHRHLRRRHGQPVLHDRHGRRAARPRDSCRGDPDGEDTGWPACWTAIPASIPTRS